LRHTSWVLGAASATALLALAACELVLGDLPPVGAGGSSGAPGGAASSTARSSVTGATTATSGSGAAGATSASSSSSGAGGACCDCDDDHVEAEGACGGKDCNDHNALVYPGEPTYYGTADPVVGFDYDCSGTIDPEPSLDKTVSCSVVLSACPTTTQGYLAQTPPACGAMGQWGTCAQQGLDCVNQPLSMVQMLCK
jgi:hypothetical protein